jgi:hypothetical protein
MKKELIGKFGVLALFMLVLVAGTQAQSPQESQDKDNSPPNQPEKAAKKKATTKLHVVVTAVVTAGEDPKPIAGAQVDVTWKEEGVDDSASGHTGEDGGVDLTVPRGKVLIQVIARHWNLGGASRDLQAEKETVEIRLQ